MNQQNEQMSALDVLSLFSTMLSLANYSENLSQSKAADLLRDAVQDLHGHLKEQDEKIEKILEELENAKNQGNH